MDSHVTHPADPSLIRPDIVESLDAYAQHGRPLGDFLQAVVANLLVDAACRADSDNLRTLAAIAGYVYNVMPAQCWGSRKVYECWITYHTHLRGNDEAAQLAASDALMDALRDARSRR